MHIFLFNRGNIRWITDNDIKGGIRFDTGKDINLPESNIGLVLPGISTGNRQGSLRNIPGGKLRRRHAFFYTDGNTTASGANIQDMGSRKGILLQKQLHQFFGFRTGNQYLFIDQNPVAVKPSIAQDILDWTTST